MRYLLRICCLMIFALVMHNATAQVSKYQALYIYNFTKYINFDTNPIRIGVMGNSPVLIELQKRVQVGVNLEVIKLSGNDRISDCNMIFVPKAQARNFSMIQSAIGEKPIIVISETEGLISEGAELAFYSEGGKLKFVLNKTAMNATNIQVSSSLLGLAKVVD